MQIDGELYWRVSIREEKLQILLGDLLICCSVILLFLSSAGGVEKKAWPKGEMLQLSC